jgi:hypothetical protein
MKKVLIVLLTAILAFASAASSAEIDELAWNHANIKTLRTLGKAAVFRFVTGGDTEKGISSLSDIDMFNWYPAGDGKYELAVGWSSGPDIASLTIYWKDAPRKVRSQDFYFPPFYSGPPQQMDEWYKGKQFENLSGDGKDELILFDPIDHTERAPRRLVPNGAWPQVFRLHGGQYVEASRDFPDFYEKEFLPQIDKEIIRARDYLLGLDPMLGEQYLAAMIMSRDKVLRFLGRDPMAGLAQARDWMTSSDPVIVDDARAVFIDIGGHEKDVHATELALDHLSKDWLS